LFILGASNRNFTEMLPDHTETKFDYPAGSVKLSFTQKWHWQEKLKFVHLLDSWIFHINNIQRCGQIKAQIPEMNSDAVSTEIYAQEKLKSFHLIDVTNHVTMNNEDMILILDLQVWTEVSIAY